MTHFKMENHNYYDNAETYRNRWFDTNEGLQNEDFHLNKNERTQNKDSLSESGKEAKTRRLSKKSSQDIGHENDAPQRGSAQEKRTLSQSIDIRKKSTDKSTSQPESNSNQTEHSLKDKHTGYIDHDETRLESNEYGDKFFKDIEEKERRWHEKSIYNVNISTIKMIGTLYKNISAQYENFKVILPHVENESLSKLMFNTLERYRSMLIQIENQANQYNTAIVSSAYMSRIISRANLRIRLMGNFSTSGIIEGLILSAMQGIMELGKLLRANHDIALEVHTLSANYIEAEEAKIERLKYYL